MTLRHPGGVVLALCFASCAEDPAAVATSAPPERGPASPPPPGFVLADRGGVSDPPRFRRDPDGWSLEQASATTTVSSRGVTVTPRGAAQALSLRTTVAGCARVVAPEALGEGAVTLDHCGVREEVRALDEAIEQRWTFAARPAGDRAEVRLAAGGMRYAGTTERGVRFEDPGSGVALRYGHGTWIDAAGARTAVSARFERGEIVLEVPRDVVARSNFPAVLDPVVVREVSVEVGGPALWRSESQAEPSVASNGSVALVVWRDTRLQSSGEIYGARVRLADGRLLDPYGFRIGRGPGASLQPEVSASGDDFLVAWTATLTDASTDIVAHRVRASDGAILETAPIPVAVAPGNQRGPRIGCSRSQCLVTWLDERYGGGFGVMAARVRPEDGAVLDGAPRYVLTSGSVLPFYRRVLMDGGTYHVADNQPSGWRVVPVDATTGDTGAELVLPRSSADESPWGLGMLGSTLFSLTASRTSPYPVTLRRFDLAGRAVGAPVQVLRSAPNSNCAVGADGARLAIACATDAVRSDIVRINADGTLVDPTPINFGVTTATQLALGGDRDRTVLVGAVPVASGSPLRAIRAWRFAAGGGLLDAPPLGLSRVETWQARPSIASDGLGALVAWQEVGAAIPSAYQSYVRRLGPDGTPLPSPPIALESDENGAAAPQVIYGAGVYLVTWLTNRAPTEARGIRIRASDGAVIDSTPIVFARTTGQTALGFDGTRFLVAWSDGGNFFFSRLRASDGRIDGIPGVRLNPAGTVGHSASGGIGVSIACAPAECLILQTYVNPAETEFIRVAAVRVNNATGAVGPTQIVYTYVLGDLRASVPHAVAYTGTRFIASIRQGCSACLRSTATFPIPAVGSVVELPTGLPYFGPPTLPALAWNNDVGLLISHSTTGTAGIYDLGLEQFDRDGVIDAAARTFWPRPTSTTWEALPVWTPESASWPSATAVSRDRWLAAVTVQSPYGNSRYTRVRVIEIARGGLGAQCGRSSDCAAGAFCVDGVCCNSACGGGLANDCMACSRGAGAAANGVCGPVRMGFPCRPSAAVSCDLIERCDGVSMTCPADRVLASCGLDAGADAPSDVGADARPDAPRDVASEPAADMPVTLPADAPLDVAPDGAVDVAPDAPARDVTADGFGVDVAPDAPAEDAGRDAPAPDAPPDVATRTDAMDDAPDVGTEDSPRPSDAATADVAASDLPPSGDAAMDVPVSPPDGAPVDVIDREGGGAPPGPPSGCGCGAAGASTSRAQGLVLLALAWVVRRRRAA